MEINQLATRVEKNFNIAASIPVVGIVSGWLHVKAAAIQIIASMGMGSIGVAGQIFSSDPKWERMAKKSVEHFAHGVSNGIRGQSEMLLGWTFVGGPFLGILQLASKNKFDPLLKYS